MMRLTFLSARPSLTLGLLHALAALLILTGCAGVPGYQPIDLKADLDAGTLARYKTEMPQGGGLLEKTDGRLLGALIFWKGGAVEAMPMSQGPVYMVSETLGLGPLDWLYIEKTWSTYDASGRRLSTMGGYSVAWGCVAMTHAMETRRANGAWHNHWTGHFVHHMLNFSDMDGKKGFALLSMPNPIQVGD